MNDNDDYDDDKVYKHDKNTTANNISTGIYQTRIDTCLNEAFLNEETLKPQGSIVSCDFFYKPENITLLNPQSNCKCV